MPTANQPSRRDLLRGIWKESKQEAHLPKRHRPPGALSEHAFLSLCIRCDDCRSNCPEQIIVKGQGGFPELSFNTSGCTGCGSCIDVCKTGALKQPESIWPLGLAQVSDQCVGHQGVTCQSCRDACEPEAIKFNWQSRSAVPEISDECTGCGFCVTTCPTDAIFISQVIGK